MTSTADDAALIDMGVLRSRLLAVQDRVRAGLSDEALELLESVLRMVNPRLDPDASHPATDKAVVTAAITAAHEELLVGGLVNPAELLIVQTHDDAGKTTSRTLASSIANPQDVLRLVLKNVERHNAKARARS